MKYDCPYCPDWYDKVGEYGTDCDSDQDGEDENEEDEEIEGDEYEYEEFEIDAWQEPRPAKVKRHYRIEAFGIISLTSCLATVKRSTNF